MKCAPGHAGTASSARCSSARTVLPWATTTSRPAGVRRERRARARIARAVGSSRLRWLPALAARPRGTSLLRSPTKSTSPTSWRPVRRGSRVTYDVSIVEGSIMMPRTPRASARSARLAAADHDRRARGAGGIQALRNFAEVEDFMSVVVRQPQYDLDAARPRRRWRARAGRLRAARAARPTSAEPLEVISAFLHDRRPAIATHSVCVSASGRATSRDGRRRHALPGPVDDAAAALCPSHHRGCYGARADGGGAGPARARDTSGSRA